MREDQSQQGQALGLTEWLLKEQNARGCGWGLAVPEGAGLGTKGFVNQCKG